MIVELCQPPQNKNKRPPLLQNLPSGLTSAEVVAQQQAAENNQQQATKNGTSVARIIRCHFASQTSAQRRRGLSRPLLRSHTRPRRRPRRWNLLRSMPGVSSQCLRQLHETDDP